MNSETEETQNVQSTEVESTALLAELVAALDSMEHMRTLGGRLAFYDRLRPIKRKAKMFLNGISEQDIAETMPCSAEYHDRCIDCGQFVPNERRVNKKRYAHALCRECASNYPDPECDNSL